MCTLLLGLHTDPRWPLVVAANRDELYSRRATAPEVLAPGIVGGRDLTAGGTWMGVTPGGFFAGLTNQARLPGPPAARSRGEVVVRVLALGATEAAGAWLANLPTADYLPFNLVFGTADGLTVAYARPDRPVWFEPVPPGLHVLPNDVLDSPLFPKVERARALADGTLESMQAALQDTLTPVNLPPPPPHLSAEFHAAVHRLLVRTPVYGTVSATVLALEPGHVARYLFAPGAPDQTSFADVIDRVYESAPSAGDR